MTAVLESERAVTARDACRVEETFSYRPMSVLAIIGCVVGVLSTLLMLVWLILPLAAMGLAISLLAIWKIRSSQGELTGMRQALAGAVLSTTALAGGIGYQWHAF